ncbi:hypothetical protein ABNM51_28870, partial [Pseudomonas syringae]
MDQEGTKSLIPADKAVAEARRALPFGRGNIDVDAQLSNLESGARTLAGTGQPAAANCGILKSVIIAKIESIPP